MTEGAPDALAAVTLGLATPGEGVIAAYGAEQLPSLAPWCASRPVTIWPHGDPAGERGARALRDRLRERVRVHFGRRDLGDVLIGQEPARVPDSWEGDGGRALGNLRDPGRTQGRAGEKGSRTFASLVAQIAIGILEAAAGEFVIVDHDVGETIH